MTYEVNNERITVWIQSSDATALVHVQDMSSLTKNFVSTIMITGRGKTWVSTVVSIKIALNQYTGSRNLKVSYIKCSLFTKQK